MSKNRLKWTEIVSKLVKVDKNGTKSGNIVQNVSIWVKNGQTGIKKKHRLKKAKMEQNVKRAITAIFYLFFYIFKISRYCSNKVQATQKN